MENNVSAMITIPTKTKGAMTSSSLLTMNVVQPNSVITLSTMESLNTAYSNRTSSNNAPQNNVTSQPEPGISAKPVPHLTNPMQKGQKITLSATPISSIKVLLGWNVKNQQCDIDVSAFLLSDSGKVIGDDWFVFYGQPDSPDRSVSFAEIQDTCDREMISVRLSGLHPSVQKIVFVLTINEAFQKHLNFSMVKDAYIRIFDSVSGQELASYPMTEYYSNVISMMIGELYQYKGTWKFHAIGNGVAKDLKGLCELYGVQVI